MRTTEELLKIMIDNIHELETGLCMLIRVLCRSKLITAEEYVFLINYICKHKPIFIFEKGYWWSMSKMAPRLKFLNKLYRRERRLYWFKNLFK